MSQARVNAEVQAATLQRQRAIEEKKMKEMEKIREQLERLLEEERQAKKDEEIRIGYLVYCPNIITCQHDVST